MGTLQSGAAPGPDTATEAPPRLSRPRLLRYLVLVLVIPAAFFPLPFFLVTSPSYEHWASSQWGPMLEYAYDTRPQNADVVIFGDSSAFIGIDPRLLNAHLGLKSLVLPDTVGSIPVTGDAPLRSYLAHNRPPRLLVFYFAAWDLDFAQVRSPLLFEGEEMMLRHGTRQEIAVFTLHHPTEMLQFPFRLYSTFGTKIIEAALHHADRERQTAEALGHADDIEDRPPLTSSCVLPTEFHARTGTGSVEDLVRRYSTPETRVMVYIAPLPACRGSAAVEARSFAAVGAAKPKILPPGIFVSGLNYAHMVPAAVPIATGIFEQALRSRLEQSDLQDLASRLPRGQ